jgi:hypothetical protein
LNPGDLEAYVGASVAFEGVSVAFEGVCVGAFPQV